MHYKVIYQCASIFRLYFMQTLWLGDWLWSAPTYLPMVCGSVTPDESGWFGRATIATSSFWRMQTCCQCHLNHLGTYTILLQKPIWLSDCWLHILVDQNVYWPKSCSICSKDVRLPVQLQRAMAAEAEAAREARAKVSNLQSLNHSHPNGFYCGHQCSWTPGRQHVDV